MELSIKMIGTTINIDIDTDNAYAALKAYYNLAHFFERVYVRQSSSKGFHLEAIIPQEIDFHRLVDFRLAFGDDMNRIIMDEKSIAYGKPKGVLFDWKNGKWAGKWYKSIRPIPVPFKNSKIPFRRRKNE